MYQSFLMQILKLKKGNTVMYLQSIIHFANHYLQIYSMTDCFEILFFIAVTYQASMWLYKDYTKPLLLYFYNYLALLFGSYFFQCATIYNSMLIAAPIYFTILIIYHQKNLQKNFIIAHNKPLTPAKPVQKEWLETLIKACLVASHYKKNITCIIEQQDALDTLIDKPCTLDIDMQKQIITMLLESNSYDANKLIIVNRYGMITSINASWSELITNELLFTHIRPQQMLQEYAKVVTAKTDSILLHVNSQHQHHFIAHQGRIVEHISIDQALKLIKNLLYKKDSASLSQGINHDIHKSASLSSFYKN